MVHVNQRIYSIIIRFGFHRKKEKKKHALIDECAADNLITDHCIAKGDANIHISFAWDPLKRLMISFIASLTFLWFIPLNRILSEMLICFLFKSMASFIFFNSFKDCDEVQKTPPEQRNDKKITSIYHWLFHFSLHKSSGEMEAGIFFFNFPQSIALSNQNVTNWMTFIRLMFQIGSKFVGKWTSIKIYVWYGLIRTGIFPWQPKRIDG